MIGKKEIIIYLIKTFAGNYYSLKIPYFYKEIFCKIENVFSPSLIISAENRETH